MAKHSRPAQQSPLAAPSFTAAGAEAQGSVPAAGGRLPLSAGSNLRGEVEEGESEGSGIRLGGGAWVGPRVRAVSPGCREGWAVKGEAEERSSLIAGAGASSRGAGGAGNSERQTGVWYHRPERRPRRCAPGSPPHPAPLFSVHAISLYFCYPRGRLPGQGGLSTDQLPQGLQGLWWLLLCSLHHNKVLDGCGCE